ncbi:MAG: TIM barrel protein [Verrucomicrobiota bacterium]
MKILFFRSIWGLEETPTLEAQLRKIKAGGFDGVEMAVPADAAACREARKIIDDLGLAVIAQQCRTAGQTVAEHTAGFAAIFERALLLRPLHLNSHTGRDHFTFDQNLEIFDHAAALAAQHEVELLHETHRGRALFSAPATERFLVERPQLRLVADFSHWCCVHESLLADQSGRVTRAIKHSSAIHARIGHDQGPQIPDPRDPLWQSHLDVHWAWWKKIVAQRRAEGRSVLCVTPEFGPAPYMTLLPHTHKPIADLWEINLFMRDWFKEQLTVSLA